MLAIDKTTEDNKTVFKLKGKLDTMTAPELDAQLEGALDSVEELIFDFTELEYISSAGLRVILKAQKEMLDHGEMKITGVNKILRDIFDAVGFSDILTIVP